MFKSSCISVVVAVLLWLGLGAYAQDKAADKRDLLAKQVAEAYMRAVWKQDVEAVMKCVDVPFFWDGRRNIDEVPTLKNEIQRILNRDRSGTTFKVKAVYSFAELPKETLKDEHRELLT